MKKFMCVCVYDKKTKLYIHLILGKLASLWLSVKLISKLPVSFRHELAQHTIWPMCVLLPEPAARRAESLPHPLPRAHSPSHECGESHPPAP